MKPKVADVADRRSALSHTWLKRRLIAHLVSEREEWAAQPSGAPLPSVLQALPVRIAEVRTLAVDVVDAYSPAVIADGSPLSVVPAAARAAIAASLHEEYLAAGVVQPLVEGLRGALARFEVCAARVNAAWTGGDARARTDVLDALRVAAEDLRGALDALPERVIVP